MISHECGYVGLKKSRMLVCVCFEVETAISTVFKLLKIVSSAISIFDLPLFSNSFIISYFVLRLNAFRFLSILHSSWTLNDNNYILA